MSVRNVTTLFDLSDAEIRRVFQISQDLKEKHEAGVREPILSGRVLAILFEKPSLRTRVSFEAGMAHLGGSSLFLGPDVGWGDRESVADFSRVLGQYVDVVVCRAKSHQRVQDLAEHAMCPVINGLTDLSHPCQALTDLFTLQELRGTLDGCNLAFVGDGNNVARSLAVACASLGANFAIATPPGYELDADFLARLRERAPQFEVRMCHDPRVALHDAHAVYTDVWASMGQENEQAERAKHFESFQVNAELMAQAPVEAHFLHCLPAKRGQEVSAEVIDGPQSAVVQQAANRLHVQKGLLAWLLS